MRHLALAALIIATPALAGEWTKLTGPEIAEALTGRTLVWDDTTQDFRASGKTLYTHKGRDSWGNWEVRGDQYCSQWPPNSLWSCYDMTRSGGRLRFIGAGAGDITEAEVQ
ncbi:MAG: hypothetical protein AAFY38_02700 [Pseudomonadota bacterium]